MKKFISNRIVGIILFITLWFVLSLIIGENTFIFPGPKQTFNKVLEILKDSYVYRCIYQTMIRMFLGFILAFILAFIFGVVAGNSNRFKQLLSPTITIFKSLPTATLVYLFLVLVGAKNTPLLIVTLVSFPILYESIVGGIEETPKELIEASMLDSASIIQANIYIKIPLAFPYILIGIASSFALSLKIEIMAEVITGYTRLGLGSAILAAQRSDPTNMVPVFAYSFIAILIMLIFDTVSNIIKKKMSVV